MTTLRRSPALIVWLTIAACCLTVPLAAAAPAPAPAPDDACAAASPNPPKPAAPDPAAPRISDLKFLQVTRLGNRARFRLAISGSNLGSGLGSAKVYFTTKDAAHPVEDVNYLTVNPRELVVEATAPIGAEISRVDVEVGGKSGSSDGLVV